MTARAPKQGHPPLSAKSWPTLDDLRDVIGPATDAAVREVLTGRVAYYGPGQLWHPPTLPECERADGLSRRVQHERERPRRREQPSYVVPFVDRYNVNLAAQLRAAGWVEGRPGVFTPPPPPPPPPSCGVPGCCCDDDDVIALIFERNRMSTKSEYAAYPAPKTAIPLIAPDMHAEVQRTIDENPQIDSMDEEQRGEIIDITDWRINGGLDRPWGRKARNNDPANPNLNTDGMTYLRPDGLFEIYDCISGIDGNATWDGYGPFAQGENGYWWPPQPVDNQPLPPTPTPDLDARVTAVEVDVAALDTITADLQGQVAQLQNRIDNLHAHGYVDLPVVVETDGRASMRARGDIDVEVKG